MKPVIIPLFDNIKLASTIAALCNYDLGSVLLRNFPDEESYLRVDTEVKNRQIIFIASLNKPNNKILALLFAVETARDMGATSIGLIAPYLAYMRQDKRFHPGEALSSNYFLKLLSQYFDWMITVDPHLHRHHDLNKIFIKPNIILHADEDIAAWIKQNVNKPLIIGPDEESKQWVSNVAKLVEAPFVILTKIRKGDREVDISVPGIKQYKEHTPILLDDIISTATTMLKAVQCLQKENFAAPICIGIHAIFAGNAYQDLLASGADKIISCNTIEHLSNKIDISGLVAQKLKNFQLT